MVRIPINVCFCHVFCGTCPLWVVTLLGLIVSCTTHLILNIQQLNHHIYSWYCALIEYPFKPDYVSCHIYSICFSIKHMITIGGLLNYKPREYTAYKSFDQIKRSFCFHFHSACLESCTKVIGKYRWISKNVLISWCNDYTYINNYQSIYQYINISVLNALCHNLYLIDMVILELWISALPFLTNRLNFIFTRWLWCDVSLPVYSRVIKNLPPLPSPWSIYFYYLLHCNTTNI